MNSQQTANLEKYLAPKQLQEALCAEFGLCFTVRYIRSIRRATIQAGDGIFVGRAARPSEVIQWLKDNPKFSRRV